MEKVLEAVQIEYAYKDRKVLKGVSFEAFRAEIFGLLGPNGSGKTTLFKILSTLFRLQHGNLKVENFPLPQKEKFVREKIGVVFQAPSVDGKLTVRENLIHQGHLYGLSGKNLNQKVDEMLNRLGLSDRAKEKTEKLSGGLKRRVELAKGLLHQPSILILDEPSTGLDPGARIDLWKYLKSLRDQYQMTILVTTHLMDEAEHCDRIAILNEGNIIRLGTPAELKSRISGDVVFMQTKDPKALAEKIKSRFQITPTVLEHGVQVEHKQGAEILTRFAEAFPGEIEAITFRKPTLEDVFMHETGHVFWNGEGGEKK